MSDRYARKRPDKSANPNATRDHLANERTMLAWIRSSIAIIALGFVVAKFGLLVRELGKAPRHTPVNFSAVFGVALVVCGAVLVILATVRYRRTALAIEDNDYEHSAALVLVLCGGFVAVAIVLGIYMVLSE